MFLGIYKVTSRILLPMKDEYTTKCYIIRERINYVVDWSFETVQQSHLL